jgi:hypothetical protein
MSSFIHFAGEPYLIMSEEQLDARTKRLKVSRYRGGNAPDSPTNSVLGLEILAVDDMVEPTDITLRTIDRTVPSTPLESAPVKGGPIAMAPDYSPPEGEATMKVYCLESDAGSRYWYVNASKTKQYREEYGMEQATFITFDVPKTKAGLIHFLNEVCG